jgi:transcription initiation factor IIE alpha subunit
MTDYYLEGYLNDLNKLSMNNKPLNLTIGNYHKCKEMPEIMFAEKEFTCWHIHKTSMKHSQFRVNLKQGFCPYCKCNLENDTNENITVEDFESLLKKLSE